MVLGYLLWFCYIYFLNNIRKIIVIILVNGIMKIINIYWNKFS